MPGNDVHIVNFGGEYSINALIPGPQQDEVGKEKSKRAFIPDPPETMETQAYYDLINEYAKTLDIPDSIEKFQYAACHWIFNEIRRANGLGIFCHPYWLTPVLQVPPEFVDFMMKNHPFDAFEVLGGENYFE
jgi:hypothetical protein